MKYIAPFVRTVLLDCNHTLLSVSNQGTVSLGPNGGKWEEYNGEEL